MPYDIRIVPGREFIRLDAKGELDLRASREILSDIAAKCVNNRVDRVLLDLRNVLPDLQPIDVYELATSFQESNIERQDRLAILHGPDALNRAATFASLATKRGWQVRDFDNFEHAFNWLNEGRS